MSIRIKAFIIHSSFLEIRKKRIDDLVTMLAKYIDFEFIELFNPNAITQESIDQAIKIESGNDMFDVLLSKNLYINQASNILKHNEAIKRAVSQQGEYDFFMVLEDDVLFSEDVGQRIVDLCVAMTKREDVNFVMLGLPPSREGLDTPFTDVKEICQVLPSCDSYLIKSTFIYKWRQMSQFSKFAYNVQISYNFFKTGTEILHSANPNIFIDGSKVGIYLSSITANHHLIYNPDFTKLALMINGTIESTNAEIEQKFVDIKFKNHPEYLHMKSLYMIKNEKYDEAEILLQGIFDLLNQNGCIINNTSEFLKTYMGLYKYKQTDL